MLIWSFVSTSTSPTEKTRKEPYEIRSGALRRRRLFRASCMLEWRTRVRVVEAGRTRQRDCSTFDLWRRKDDGLADLNECRRVFEAVGCVRVVFVESVPRHTARIQRRRLSRTVRPACSPLCTILPRASWPGWGSNIAASVRVPWALCRVDRRQEAVGISRNVRSQRFQMQTLSR